MPAPLPKSTAHLGWQEWSEILAAAGIPHAGTQTMRHSAATIALEEGVALAVVQETLGAAYRNRTDDLFITSESLCRLS